MGALINRVYQTGQHWYLELVHKLLLKQSSMAGQAVWRTDEVSWLKHMEDNYQVILAELEAFRTQSKSKVDKDDLYPGLTEGFGKEPWEMLHLMLYGGIIDEVARQFPKTMAIVEQNVPKHCSVMFSILPGARKDIPLHSDDKNGTLRMHLGLQIPTEGSNYISIGGEQLSWQDGKAFVLDATCPHSVKKTSEGERIIMMVDFIRPTSRLLEWLGYTQYVKIKGKQGFLYLQKKYQKLL
jgi:aspartyl/asparaginyl beta-hydroxylase (cupin superfamily)